MQREIVRNLVVDVAYVGNRGAWLPSNGAVNYNANTPQSLLAAGLDITSAADRAILDAPIASCGCRHVPEQAAVRGFHGHGSAVAAAVPAIHDRADAAVGPIGR